MKLTTIYGNGAPNSSIKEIPGDLAYVQLDCTGTTRPTNQVYLDTFAKVIVVANYIDSSNDSIILPNFSVTQYTSIECDVWAYGPNGTSINVWLQSPNYQFVDGSTNIMIPCGSMKTFMVISVVGLPSTVTVGVK